MCINGGFVLPPLYAAYGLCNTQCFFDLMAICQLRPFFLNRMLDIPIDLIGFGLQ